MSIINSMGVGKAKGSMGNVTYTTDKAGRTIGRQKPVEVANPRSEAQTFNRTRLIIAQLIASGMLSLLNAFRTRTKANVSQYSEFVGYLLKLSDWTTDSVVNLGGVIIQYFKGSLEQFTSLATASASYDNVDKEITFAMNWDSTTFGNGQATDTIKAVLINLTKGRVEMVSDPAARSTGALNAAFVLLEPNDVYQIAVICARANNSLWANTGTMIAYEGGSVTILV